uniref:Ig-like domain-containing protein n=1 Tax=Amazona collaria TaxID=241587 RepID=A0A8B9FWQ4_9PSIT
MLLLAALVATTAWSCKSFFIPLSFLIGTHGCAIRHLPHTSEFQLMASFLLLSFLDGFAQIYPVQSPISITKSQRSARMTCEIKTSEEMFESMSIHWYQQKEGRAPERLLLFSEGRLSVETGFLARRYMVEKVSIQKRFILTIKDVIPDDAATYYCAYWDAHHDRNSKIITAKSPQQLNYRCHEMRGLWLLKESPSKVSAKAVLLFLSWETNSEILQKEHENQITYVCLVEKFYPEVIRVTWTDEKNEEVTGNVVKGDTWKATENEEYSIGSWLTVPVENKDKKYYCKYEHESQERSLPTQGID